MKTKFSLTLLVVFLSSCALIFAQDKSPAKTVQQKDSVYYTCSMHPEIHADKPGKCPKCGMTLIKESSSQGKKEKKHKMKMSCGMMSGMDDMDKPESSDKNNTGNTEQTKSVTDSTKNIAILYTCSMHPEIQSAKPGNCPKCGMNLTEIKK